MGAEPNPALFTVPHCDACDKPAVVEQAYSGRILCGKHLAKSVRKKISKELRVQLPLVKGGAHHRARRRVRWKRLSCLLDAIVELLGKRRDVTVVAGTVDEGIEGYRPPSIPNVQQRCANASVWSTTSSPTRNFRSLRWTRWFNDFPW